MLNRRTTQKVMKSHEATSWWVFDHIFKIDINIVSKDFEDKHLVLNYIFGSTIDYHLALWLLFNVFLTFQLAADVVFKNKIQ